MMRLFFELIVFLLTLKYGLSGSKFACRLVNWRRSPDRVR